MIAPLPWLRATVAAGLMVTLGLVMHAAAGGSPAAGPAVAMVFLAAIPLTRAAQGEPGSWRRMAPLLLLGQVAVHVAASPTSHNGMGSTAHSMATDASTMSHAAMLRRSGEAYGPKIAESVAAALGCLFADSGMLVAHLGAAAAVSWWLTAGERLSVKAAAVLSGYSAHIRAALLVAEHFTIARPKAAARPIVGAPARPVRHLLLACGTRLRGPPAYC